MAKKPKKPKKPNRLNVQGLSRREKGLLSCIVPDDGYTTVSIDLSAGEPTVTSHFSQDKNYMYACFDGVGKRPFYENGVLKIDDIYLMVMSVSPIGKSTMAEAWKRAWPAGSFADQWMEDCEVIKKYLKTARQLHKILALGIGYSMGPKKMVKQMYEAGYALSLKDARAFYKAYWELFSGVRTLSDNLTAQVEEDKYLVNPFGFRVTPEPFKAFNAFIQSTVSGIMHVFSVKLMAAAPYTQWVTCIHDELIIDCPTNRLDEFKSDVARATASLNEDLGWSVAIRTGFAPGKDWYEAK